MLYKTFLNLTKKHNFYFCVFFSQKTFLFLLFLQIFFLTFPQVITFWITQKKIGEFNLKTGSEIENLEQFRSFHVSIFRIEYLFTFLPISTKNSLFSINRTKHSLNFQLCYSKNKFGSFFEGNRKFLFYF